MDWKDSSETNTLAYYVFVPGKPFQLSLIFARSKIKAYLSGVPFRDSRLRVVDQTHQKHWTGLERLARDKHSRLLRKFINYGRKKFYNYGSRPREQAPGF